MSTVPVLFDVNGSFGKSAQGVADFPTIAARLAFMDRFGISRSLVWNVESTQNHALSSNHRLLDEIAATPGAVKRIVPALTVSGLMTYEHDGIESLAAQLRQSHARALRFTNVFGRLSLMQLEPVMRGIRKLKPFIVLRHDQVTGPDILEFAATFPEIPLVLTDVMWGPCVTVFELMRRRANILMDNSWLHTADGIELAVKTFGARRLLFGTGPRCHNGAAIAALARAKISAAERGLIAHGNLDLLTGLKTRAPAGPAPAPANSLWPLYLAGKPLTVDIVDAHGHIGPSAGYVLAAQEERRQVSNALRAMDASGIRTMLISGIQACLGAAVPGNDLVAEVLQPHPGRFGGYLAFNPFYADELVPQFDRYFAGPVYAGFKTLCDYWRVPITDSRFKPMWEYANRHRLPVLSHTWDGPYDSPRLFKELVTRYPHVAFLLGHSGGGDAGRAEAEALAQEHRNVYLEWCGSFCCSRRWEDTLRVVRPEQVVFGTDAMAHGIEWELGRLLSCNLPDKVLIPILGANMRRLLARRRPLSGR